MTSLAPGHHLYRVADGTWRHAAPGDRFIRITGDDAALTQFQRVTHIGQRASAGEGEHDDPVAQLAALYAERDLLDTAPPTSPRPAQAVVIGDNPLASALCGLLAGLVRVHRAAVDEDAATHPRTDPGDIVIDCVGWLPDGRWQELDQRCAERGTAWHRAHVEGHHLYLGPFTIPGQTSAYRDLRGRRLAASGLAEELLTHWAYLEDPGQPKPAPPTASRGAVSVTAGLLCADIEHYLRTGHPAWPNSQLGVELTTAAFTIHPVLPLPVTAP